MQEKAAHFDRWFQVAVLGLLATLVVGVLWIGSSTKNKIDQSIDKVNQHLPRIVENSDKVLVVMGGIAEDVSAVSKIAGMTATQREKGVARYTAEAMETMKKHLYGKGVQIGRRADDGLTARVLGQGVANKVRGKKLVSLRPFEEWFQEQGTESMLISLQAPTKAEALRRLCHSAVKKSTWMLKFPNKDEAVSLEDWLVENHPASKQVAQAKK